MIYVTQETSKTESFASLVRRLGNPESTTMLYSPHQRFQIPEIDGAIGYHLFGNCAVVIGDPICLPEDVPELVDAFHRYCDSEQLQTLYLLTHSEFAQWAIDNGCRTLIQVGAEVSLNPTDFQQNHNVRRKVSAATKQGVEVKEYTHHDPSPEQGIKAAVKTWLQERRGPQIHLGKLDFEQNSEDRIFYAEQNGKVVGVLILTPIERYQGWSESYNLAISEAPVGTTEHLMCSVLSCLAKENCQFLCLGAVAGKGVGEIIGLNAFVKPFTRFIFQAANWMFGLDAKAAYLSKYRPNIQPVYLVSREGLSINQLLAIKQVLNVTL